MSGIWTRNYTNALAASFGRKEQNLNILGSKSYSNSNLTVTATDGTPFKINCLEYYPVINLKSNGGLATSGNIYVLPTALVLGLGKGAGIATYEDTTLSSYIASGLTMVSGNPNVINSYNSEAHSYLYERTFSVQNTSLLNIDITEIGLFINCMNNSSNNASLIYHEFIEQITLEPNDMVLIKIVQEMPLYNYQPYPV